MNLNEPEEHALLRDSVRRWLDKECPVSKILEWEKDNSLDRGLIRKMAEAGYLGLTTPEEFGGMGRKVVMMTIVMEEMTKRSQMLLSLYNMSVGYGSLNIALEGTQAQKEYFLPRLMKGDFLFAIGFSEPNVGGDLAAVETFARREGDKVIINGAKRWTTGALLADYVYALVRTGPVEARRKNLSFIMIPTSAPGVEITPIDCMGNDGIATTDVVFTDVEAPFDLVVGGEEGWNNGWRMLAGNTLEVEKIAPTVAAVGVAAAAVEEAWAYSQQRRQFGRLICGHQAVRHVLADVQTKLHACRLVIYHAAALVEQGADSAAATSMAKLFCAETCRDIVLACQQYVMGAYGYAKGFRMESYVRDILAAPIGGGSTAIQRNNVANLLGLAKG